MKISEKYLEEFDTLFPKGDKRRGDALALNGLAVCEGMRIKQEQFEDIIEDEVVIRVKDVPEEFAGMDMYWLDKEIKKIKDRLNRRIVK